MSNHYVIILYSVRTYKNKFACNFLLTFINLWSWATLYEGRMLQNIGKTLLQSSV